MWLVLFVWGDAWALVSVDEYLSVEDLDGRTSHEYVAVRCAPLYMERSSVHVYVDSPWVLV